MPYYREFRRWVELSLFSATARNKSEFKIGCT